jgi:hypothetical protein
MWDGLSQKTISRYCPFKGWLHDVSGIYYFFKSSVQEGNFALRRSHANSKSHPSQQLTPPPAPASVIWHTWRDIYWCLGIFPGTFALYIVLPIMLLGRYGSFTYTPESTEWFTEDKAFLIWLLPHPLPLSPLVRCLSISVFLCVTGRADWREKREGRGKELYHTTARKSSHLHKSFNTLWCTRALKLVRVILSSWADHFK